MMSKSKMYHVPRKMSCIFKKISTGTAWPKYSVFVGVSLREYSSTVRKCTRATHKREVINTYFRGLQRGTLSHVPALSGDQFDSALQNGPIISASAQTDWTTYFTYVIVYNIHFVRETKGAYVWIMYWFRDCISPSQAARTQHNMLKVYLQCTRLQYIYT